MDERGCADQAKATPRTNERAVKTGLLYTPVEERFERITRLAQQALSVPIAGVMLLNDGKQWFKSIAGWDVVELPEERALCEWAFEEDGPTIIEDLENDPRTTRHPFVTGAPRFRSYAFHPLLDRRSWPMGGLCALDVKPRPFSDAQRQCLLDLAEIAQRELVAERPMSPESSLSAKLAIVRREGMIDPLTRLWNRRGAYVLVRNALDRADRSSQSLGVATIDVDGFKRLNERFGYQTGDEVLRGIAMRLVNAVRGDDLVFRLLDDQFLLLMSNIGDRLASKIFERVRWSITSMPMPTRSGELAITVEAGLTVRLPSDGASVDELIRRAASSLQSA